MSSFIFNSYNTRKEPNNNSYLLKEKNPCDLCHRIENEGNTNTIETADKKNINNSQPQNDNTYPYYFKYLKSKKNIDNIQNTNNNISSFNQKAPLKKSYSQRNIKYKDRDLPNENKQFLYYDYNDESVYKNINKSNLSKDFNYYQTLQPNKDSYLNEISNRKENYNEKEMNYEYLNNKGSYIAKNYSQILKGINNIDNENKLSDKRKDLDDENKLLYYSSSSTILNKDSNNKSFYNMKYYINSSNKSGNKIVNQSAFYPLNHCSNNESNTQKNIPNNNNPINTYQINNKDFMERNLNYKEKNTLISKPQRINNSLGEKNILENVNIQNINKNHFIQEFNELIFSLKKLKLEKNSNKNLCFIKNKYSELFFNVKFI